MLRLKLPYLKKRFLVSKIILYQITFYFTLVLGNNAELTPVAPPPERSPVIFSRQLKYLPKSIEPRSAWVENLDTLEEQKIGVVDLHPEVWGVMPRIDIISKNIHWQRHYRYVVRRE